MSRDPVVLIVMRGRLGAYAEPMREWARDVVRHAGRRMGLGAQHEISVLLCDNPTIRRLNRRWRHVDRPTDVISFPMHSMRAESAAPDGAIGDIAVSLPFVRRSARQENIPERSELARMLLHGLLHCLGFVHQVDADRKRMERRVELLLTEVLNP